jgi:competence protein ComEA
MPMPELLRPEPPRSLLDRLSRVRSVIDPARAAAALGVVALVIVAGWWLVRPTARQVETDLPMASTVPVASPPSLAPVEVVVQVAGAVARPGVYRLADGARVVDLVDAAGGALADADLQALALAGRLTDGQRVQVPRQGEVLPPSVLGAPPGGGGDGAGGASVPLTPIDLNAATMAELDALPGIGPATAQAILTYRERNGPFRTVEDLGEVQGIGPARLDALRELVRV